MKVIVANKDDYIKFNAMLLDKMKTFELTEDATDYIIHRVKLGDETQDVSLMDSCINNLLEEQYEKREYIKIEEIQVINNLISKLNENECRILNAYAVLKVEVVNKKEFEEKYMYGKVTIYLPTTKERLEEKFRLINLDYNKLTIQDTHVTKCEIVNFTDEILSDRFNKVMKYEIDKFFRNSYLTPFQEIELLCKEVRKFDNIRMQKFLALLEVKD